MPEQQGCLDAQTSSRNVSDITTFQGKMKISKGKNHPAPPSPPRPLPSFDSDKQAFSRRKASLWKLPQSRATALPFKPPQQPFGRSSASLSARHTQPTWVLAPSALPQPPAARSAGGAQRKSLPSQGRLSSSTGQAKGNAAQGKQGSHRHTANILPAAGRKPSPF